jgi:hypothetical protein
MIYLDRAILTRYNAVGLNTSIGQLYDEQQPEGSILPYVSLEDASDNRYVRTQTSSYHEAMVTLTVWHTQKDLCEQACELIEINFTNCNFALTNPLVLPQPFGVVKFRLSSPYILRQVSDTIWSGAQTFVVIYRRAPILVPP